MTTSRGARFGTLLRQHRLMAGLTQEALAERAGLSTRGVQDLERGIRQAPRAETVRLIADALELDAAARADLMAAARPELATPLESVPEPRLAPLPIAPTPLIGREQEVAAVYRLLGSAESARGSRLVTLTGPGGVGKSRLALAAATELTAEFPDGVAWVELAALRDARLVPKAIADALGLREGVDQSPLETLIRVLAGRRLLLVLDNFEQLLAAAPLVAQLLAAAPNLAVLATSRTRLRLRAERELPVPPLTTPLAVEETVAPLAGLAAVPAVRLFVERASDVRPEFALTAENVVVIAAICRLLDGLPLALELAAARVKLLPPASLLARLDQRLPLLSGGARDMPARHQTMWETIAWSHELLAPPEQVFFRRLAVFVGGFTLDAATWVTDEGDRTTLELLTSLVEQSLLRPLAGAGGEPRFSFLETVREYASHCLTSSGEEVALRRAHAEHYFAFAERAATELTGPAQTVWLDRLEVEHDNLRATLTWTIEQDSSTALRLVAALWRFWYMRGHMREGRAWAEAALARSGGSPGERARALHVAGDLAQEQGDYPRASALLSTGREVALAAGDPAVAALCLNGLGFIARNLGAFEEAATHHAEALELQRGLEDRRAIACTLANLGSIAQNRGEVESAETLFAEALATFRTIDDRALAADVSTNLAILANQVGDHERAHRLAADALVTYRALGDRQACATALAAVAKAERGLGAAAQAEERYEEALTLFRSVDHQLGIAVVLDHLAGMRLDEADPEAARPLLTESLHILQATGDRPEIITALETVIRVARALNLWHAVARLSGAIATLRAAVDTGPRAIEIVDQGPILAAADALGELEFSAAEAAGRALRQEEALAEALRIVELGA